MTNDLSQKTSFSNNGTLKGSNTGGFSRRPKRIGPFGKPLAIAPCWFQRLPLKKSRGHLLSALKEMQHNLGWEETSHRFNVNSLQFDRKNATSYWRFRGICQQTCQKQCHVNLFSRLPFSCGKLMVPSIGKHRVAFLRKLRLWPIIRLSFDGKEFRGGRVRCLVSGLQRNTGKNIRLINNKHLDIWGYICYFSSKSTFIWILQKLG